MPVADAEERVGYASTIGVRAARLPDRVEQRLDRLVGVDGEWVRGSPVPVPEAREEAFAGRWIGSWPAGRSRDERPPGGSAEVLRERRCRESVRCEQLHRGIVPVDVSKQRRR